jgi:phage shock protein E
MLELPTRLFIPAGPAEVDIAAPTVTEPAAAEPVGNPSLDALVIDVRSEREFQATAIEHAINVPLPQLAHRIGKLVADKATPLVLYCASGARSGIGRGVLKQLGYTHVTNAGSLYAAAERLRCEVRR